MRILLTGSTGFLGSATLRDCLRDGHEVTVLVRQASIPLATARFAGNGFPRPIRVLPGDVTEPAWGIARPEGLHFDAVIHAAGCVSLGRDAARIAMTNALAVRNFESLASRASMGRVIHFSTAFVCANEDGFLEEAPATRGAGANAYERSKTLAEHWLMSRWRGPLDIVRPGIVIPTTADGVDASPLGAFRSAWRRLRRGPVRLHAAGEVRPGFVELDDVRACVRALLNTPPRATPAWWNLAQPCMDDLAGLRDAFNTLPGFEELQLVNSHGHPIFSAWRPYLSTHRDWARDNTERLLGRALQEVTACRLAGLIAVRADSGREAA